MSEDVQAGGQKAITMNHDSPRRVAGGRGGTLTPFNSDSARAAVRAREEKRIRLYTEGAGRAVQDTQLIREYGKDAHIVERGMTLQQIATTPDAGKAAVMAAQALDVAQGLIVKGKPETADSGVTFDDAQRDLIRDLAAIATAIDAERQPAPTARRVSAEIGAIDAEVTPTEDG